MNIASLTLILACTPKLDPPQAEAALGSEIAKQMKGGEAWVAIGWPVPRVQADGYAYNDRGWRAADAALTGLGVDRTRALWVRNTKLRPGERKDLMRLIQSPLVTFEGKLELSHGGYADVLHWVFTPREDLLSTGRIHRKSGDDDHGAWEVPLCSWTWTLASVGAIKDSSDVARLVTWTARTVVERKAIAEIFTEKAGHECQPREYSSTALFELREGTWTLADLDVLPGR